MKHTNLLAGMAAAVLTLSACSDDTLNIGNTLTQQTDKLNISTADYQVTTRTVRKDSVALTTTVNGQPTQTVVRLNADSVLFRSSFCYLGRVKDPETGAYVTSEFMTQYNLMQGFSLQSEAKIESRSNNMAACDSCHLEFYMESPTSITDTLAALKIRIQELDHPMEEDRRYYSNFDPVKEGYIRTDGLTIDKMFSYCDQTVKDSLRGLSNYYHNIDVKLNKPYTDKNGVTYNNYGTYIMQQYYAHPEYFKNAYTFIHNVCPGFYVSVIDGEGVYTEIPDMALRMYYRYKNDKDSLIKTDIALAGTDEVLQTTKISTEDDVLQMLAEDNTCTYIKAPAGLFTEVQLPIDDIYRGHENDSIMTAKISFQRINNNFYDEALDIPGYVMMIPKDSIYAFFEKKMTPDNKQTFYSSYLNSNGRNATNQYTFANISSLITQLAYMKRKGIKNEGEEIWLKQHPNWDKVLLVPVQMISSATTTTTTSSTSYSFENCMSIVSTKLVGGTDNPYDPVKINIVYGKFDK